MDSKFKPGQPRSPNAGRKKGTPNKRTKDFMQVLDQNDFDPASEYIACYRGMIRLYKKRLTRGNIPGAVDTLDRAGHMLDKICQYAYPKKKAIEHTGEVGVKTFADFMAAAELESGDEPTDE